MVFLSCNFPISMTNRQRHFNAYMLSLMIPEITIVSLKGVVEEQIQYIYLFQMAQSDLHRLAIIKITINHNSTQQLP